MNGSTTLAPSHRSPSPIRCQCPPLGRRRSNRRFYVSPLHRLYLRQPPHVPFLAAKPRLHDLARQLEADHARPQREHIHVVVLDALVRGIRIVANRRPNARQLAGRDRRADAAAADEDPSLGAPVPYRLAHSERNIGIVDRIRAVRAYIEHVVPVLAKARRQGVLQLVTTMISAYDDPHGLSSELYAIRAARGPQRRPV